MKPERDSVLTRISAQTEAAERISESHLQTIFDSVDQGYLEVEVEMSPDGRAVDWRYLVLNPAFERLTGMNDVTGRLVSEVAPDLEPEWAERYAQVVITGKPMRFELPAAAIGRCFDVNLINLGGPGNCHVAAVYDDITERKRAALALLRSDERQAFLLKLSDALRPLGDPLEVQSVALRVLGEHLAVNRAFFNDVDEARDTYVINRTYANGVLPRTGQFRLSDIRRTAEIAGSGQIVVFDDVGADPRFSQAERAAFADMEVAAGVGVPLIKDGRWVAGLGVHSATPRQWAPEEIDLIRETSERTWAAVERARAEAALRASETRVRDVLENMGEAFVLLDREFRIVDLNAEAMRLEDRPREAIIGKTHWEAHPGAAPELTDLYRLAMAERREVALEHRYVWPDGRDTWLAMRAFPAGDGLAVFYRDVTDRKVASEALRQSEERYRALTTVGSSSIYRMSPDWRELRALDGAGFVADIDEPTTDWIQTYVPADERPRVEDAIERAIRTKTVFELEHRMVRVDGTTGWTFSRAIPLFDDAGEIVEWFGVASDVTERVKADQSFTRLFEASPAPFLVLKPDRPLFTIAEVNDAYLAATMRTREELVGRALFDAFPDNPNEPSPTSVSKLRASLEAVLASRKPDRLPGLKYDVRRPDGTYAERWWSPINSPILNERGEVEAIIHNANDVTKARRSEQHQALLLAELQHRVRNILTMVSSIARRTADNYANVDDYVHHLDGRLATLGRVQAILTRDPGRGVDLHAMILDELENQTASPKHYRIKGPDVVLPSKAAEILSLAIHELATNSTKYGVLSKTSGVIRIGWAVDERDGRAWLRLTWHEPVVAAIKRPVRTGFGTELITHRVPYELRGTGEMRIGDGRVEATLDFPLADEHSKLEGVGMGKETGQ